jgi:hypothetical protein
MTHLVSTCPVSAIMPADAQDQPKLSQFSAPLRRPVPMKSAESPGLFGILEGAGP